MPAFIRGMQYQDMNNKQFQQNPSIWDYFHEHGFITAYDSITSILLFEPWYNSVMLCVLPRYIMNK
jgi:hypothetical protein